MIWVAFSLGLIIGIFSGPLVLALLSKLRRTGVKKKKPTDLHFEDLDLRDWREPTAA